MAGRMLRLCARMAFELDLRNVKSSGFESKILLIETTDSHFVTLVASGVEHDSMNVRELALERTIWHQDKESTQDTLQTALPEQAIPYIYTITSFSHLHPTDTYPQISKLRQRRQRKRGPKAEFKSHIIYYSRFQIYSLHIFLYPRRRNDIISSRSQKLLPISLPRPLVPKEDPNITHLHSENQHPKQ